MRGIPALLSSPPALPISPPSNGMDRDLHGGAERVPRSGNILGTAAEDKTVAAASEGAYRNLEREVLPAARRKGEPEVRHEG